MIEILHDNQMLLVKSKDKKSDILAFSAIEGGLPQCTCTYRISRGSIEILDIVAASKTAFDLFANAVLITVLNSADFFGIQDVFCSNVGLYDLLLKLGFIVINDKDKNIVFLNLNGYFTKK